jgi:hypothetical protein
MIRFLCCLCLLTVALGSGCRKRRGESAAVPPNPEASVAAPAVPAAPAEPKNVPPEEALHFLNDAVRNFYAEKLKMPASLEEVYAAGYLKDRYNPPPGRRFVINPQTRGVELR